MNSLRPSFLPPDMPEPGFDYFATPAHQESLASRILIALGGFNLVVVTGDRLSDKSIICTALGKAAAGRYTVISFPPQYELGQHEALWFHTALSVLLPGSSAATQELDVPVLIVFYDTDRYSIIQIQEIFEHIHQRTRVGIHRITAAVFLAHAEFLTRLEHPVLSAWLAKRLFVARIRFDELGTDEVSAFVHHQLPSEEAEKIFTDQAIAAIANISGGDPVLINRYSRRVLDAAAASTDNTLQVNLGSATAMSVDMHPEVRGVTTVTDRLQQNLTGPEPHAKFSTRIWPGRVASLKLYASIAFCLTCVGVAGAVAFRHPVVEDIAASNTAPSTDILAKLPDQLTSRASPAPSTAYRAEERTAVPGKVTATAITALAGPTPEDALSSKKPSLLPSIPALRSTAEPAGAPTETVETVVNAGVSSAASTEVAPTARVVSPTKMQAPRSTPSTPDSLPAQLRLPSTEIAALLARGDALFARGDISSARLFYERAANAGAGRAALRLGNTFDPYFLEFAHLRTRGEPAMAEFWYRRARELGDTQADILLTATQRYDQNEPTAAQHKIAPAVRQSAVEHFENVTTKKSAPAAGSEQLPGPSGVTRAKSLSH